MYNRFLCFIVSLFVVAGIVSPALALSKLDEELIYRTSLGQARDVKALLDQGANANVKTDKGVPIIFSAVERQDPEQLGVVKALVEAGADINVKDGNDRYPILIAVEQSNLPMVKYLIEHNADVSVRDKQGYPVQMVAERIGNAEVIAAVKGKIDEDAAALAEKKSTNNFNKMLREYAYHSCRSQYWNFYLVSKQNPELNEDDMLKKIDNIEQRLMSILKDTTELFEVDPNQIHEVGNAARTAIASELDGMVSNRNRKAKGVGTKEDIIARCKRISMQWSLSIGNAGAK